jgi:hypothetical protein
MSRGEQEGRGWRGGRKSLCPVAPRVARIPRG